MILMDVGEIAKRKVLDESAEDERSYLLTDDEVIILHE